MLKQLFNNPQVLILTAVVIGLLGLIPGMPNLVFLMFTAVLSVISWWLTKQKRVEKTVATPPKSVVAPTNVDASWSDVNIEDILAMEVGYGLIPMVDQNQNGELLGRIRSLRKKFAQTLGFLPPQVHIRDNLSLSPYQYKIFIKGGEIGQGEIMNNKWLAINPGTVTETIEGIETIEPAFGLPAVWIDENDKENAQILGYTVVDTSTMIATHFNHLLHQFASDLLGRLETQELLDRIKQDIPKLVEDFIPDVVPLTTFHKILQNLLSEKVSIRDMRTIIETICEQAPNQNDAYHLLSIVRIALGRVITQQWFPGTEPIRVIGLNIDLERILLQALQNTSNVEPGLAEHILQQLKQALNQQDAMGAPPVLLVNHTLRAMLSQFLRPNFPQLAVLSNLEIPDNRKIQVTYQIGSEL